MKTDSSTGLLGADVGKEELVLEVVSVDRSVRHTKVVANEFLGFASVLRWLSALGFSNVVVCMEATGYFSEPFAEFMCMQNHRVFVVNPKRIRRYAEAMGLLGKSDKQDAHAIAEFALTEHEKLRPWKPRSSTRKELAKLRSHIQGLRTSLQAFENRAEALGQEFVTESAERVTALLREEIRRSETLASDLIDADDVLSSHKELLKSQIGIAEIISNALLTYIDFEAFESGRAVKRYLGLVPKREQSGKCLNTRGHISREGRSELRGLLWNAARAAIRHDPRMREFAEGLYKRGKGPDAVRIAVAAKLVTISHALIRNKTPYDIEYRSPLAS